MARILLVHGAWGNATGWARVAQRLEKAGHAVQALDLPGHGRSPIPPESVTMADYVTHVQTVLAEGPPALLVGHSMGGIVIAQVADRVPARVQGCVFVAALLPRDGDSLLSLIRTQDGPGIAPHVRPGPVSGVTTLDTGAAAALFPEASARDQAAALSAMSLQSNAAQKDPAVIGTGLARVPKAYVLCRQDQVVTPALQRRMLGATPCEAVFELDCGHVPQLTMPAELAQIIDGVARG